MKQFIDVPKPKPGDQVAVLSPSVALPGLFPWVHELGLERLQSVFQLKPKEYPTTRQMGASAEDRARDLMDAFKDPANKAVIAAIGGDGEIKLLKHLDPKVFTDNPKPFFGYSDNTHIVQYLWRLGVPAFYGGSIMTQYAMQGGMHDFTVEFLKKALFETGEVEIRSSDAYNDEGLNWADKANLTKTRKLEPNDPWQWDGTADAEGILWGGCVESLVGQLSANKWLPADQDLDGTILFIETAEDLPEPWIVDYALTAMGERGWFDKFQAVLVGRPKAWELFGKEHTKEQKVAYTQKQRETVLKAVRSYNPTIPVVQNLDFGHTDPQLCVPSGRKARVLGSKQKIFFTY